MGVILIRPPRADNESGEPVPLPPELLTQGPRFWVDIGPAKPPSKPPIPAFPATAYGAILR